MSEDNNRQDKRQSDTVGPDPSKYIKVNENSRALSKETLPQNFYEDKRSIPATVSRIKGLRSFNN